ncbi:efflux RND transporter periplasmic adaptor subunit [Bacteroidota bacterium]
MKSKLFALFIIGLLFASCGKNDKNAQLEALKAEREKLNEQISKLEKEIQSEGVGEITDENLASVKIQEIKPSEFNHYFKVQGNTESDFNIFIPAETQGIVKRIYVDEGDRVSKGQLLAELDGIIYEKGIEELQIALDLATTVFDRQKRLWDQKIGSEIQYLQAKSQKESLEKRLATTQEQYKLTKITSPIHGTVDEIVIKVGEAAIPGMGAIRVIQLSSLKISAQISEAYISDIKKKDKVKVTIPGLNKSFIQQISAVSQVIDPDNRTFSIEVKVPSSEKEIKPNMLAELLINDYLKEEAIIVPMNVLQTTGKEYFAFTAIKENGQWIAKKKKVKMGKYYENSVEILDGIEIGDNVIIFGFQNLADGQRIIIDE